jgi:ATP-binding protein involved in chromosome partitioning
LGDVEWGQLDYLLVDMPPGTGDAQLSLAQIVPLSGAVIVTTPQAVSTFDVGKAIAMFRQVNVEILGLVENMSGFVVEGRVEGANAGTKVAFDVGASTQTVTTNEDGRFHAVFNLFGAGGGDMLCKKHGFPLLGRVPLNPVVRVGGDAGDPVTIAHRTSPVAGAFRDVAGRVAQRLAIKSMQALPILQ